MRICRFGHLNRQSLRNLLAVALGLGVAATLACSPKPNYGAVCAGNGDCQGGLSCEKAPLCPGGGEADAGQCTALCTAATFATDCPDSQRENDRLLLVCQNAGDNCDGGVRSYCVLEPY